MTDDEATRQCIINADAELDRLIAKARARPASESEALRLDTRDAIARERAVEAGRSSDLERADARFQKWRLIHKFIHHHPYRDRALAARSEQWRDVLERVRDLGDGELIEWVCLQIDVARNLEQGIQDMRPRKNGPTYLVMLEYVENRKRKALAVLHWAEAGERDGVYVVNSNWHARTRRILDRHGLNETDEDGRPVASMDPMTRN